MSNSVKVSDIAAVGSLTTNARNHVIYQAAAEVAGLITDDHGTGKTIQLWGLATLEKGDKQTVVALIDARYFSLNQVYMDPRGGVHLSTGSVGGVVELHGTTMVDGIATYNEDQSSFPFSSGQLNNVVKF